MELGLACSVCGHLNLLRAVSCDRCSAVLAPQPVAAPSVAATTPIPPLGQASPPRPNPPAQPSGPNITSASAKLLATAPIPVTTPATGTAAARTPGAAPATGAPAGRPSGTVISSVQPRFNATTGAPLEAPQQAAQSSKPAAKTMFFGALQQQPVVPRLVVIKGEGGDGVTYHLSATNHIVGRSKGEIQFNEDFFLSPEHALFTVQGNRLFAKDLGSVNGVFVRIKSPVPLDHGDCFLVGEQLLRLDSAPLPDPGPDANSTYSYSSPRPDGRFRVVQLLAGGGEGRIVSAHGATLTLGREANHMNFPHDRFISGRHARLDAASDSHHIILTDTGSRNGTFIRIKGAVELFHGDYIFIGQQLLRVEIS